VVSFNHFCRGDLDVLEASRRITPDEQTMCKSGSVKFFELPVGHNAITIIVNPANTWASEITVSELGNLWAPAAAARDQVEPGSCELGRPPDQTVRTWDRIRDV
jgi:phosphate transport system substrate-binding protein